MSASRLLIVCAEITLLYNWTIKEQLFTLSVFDPSAIGCPGSPARIRFRWRSGDVRKDSGHCAL